MMRRTLSLMLALAMLMSMVTIPAFAEKGDGVIFTKTLVAGTATGQPKRLKLEAYTTGNVQTSTTSKPTDVVLVLDQSGSMDGTYLNSMKTAVEGFVKEVMGLNADNRIAIVGFASETGYGNNTEVLTLQRENKEEIITYTYEAVNVSEMDTSKHYYISYGQDYRQIRYFEASRWDAAGWYTLRNSGQRNDPVDVSNRTVYERIENTETVTEYYTGIPYGNLLDLLESNSVDLVDALTSDTEVLEDAIAALDAEGATRTDLGMELAEMILAESSRDNKIVVLLTDGVPTSWTDFDTAVANDAVESALSMKNDGVHVFSMYLGSPSTAAANFLQAVSSNYPEAESISNLGDKAAESYYAAHSSDLGIEGMLTSIVNTINANSQLNETAVVSDELTPWFELPAGSDPDQITVYTVDKTATGWSEEEVPFGNANIEIVGGDKIEVTGFNFAYHCVTETPKQSGGSDYGRKLVIYIPIIENTDADTFGGHLPTNETAEIIQNEESVIDVEGCYDDVTIRYVLHETQRSYHIGAEETYTVDYTDKSYWSDILEEMIPSAYIPDGENNLGVDMEYVLLDAGADDRDNPDVNMNDDIVLARLSVDAGKEVDPTDFSKWTIDSNAPASADIVVDSNLHFGEKLYILACRLTNTDDSDDSLMIYAVFAIDVINEDAAHVVYGTMDYGGVLSVPDNAPGSLITNTYTETVKVDENSATMTFKPNTGYEIETITIEHLKENEDGSTTVDSTEVYNVTDDNTHENVKFEDDGSYKYTATKVRGGIRVIVTTRPLIFNLTTEHDANCEIMPSQTYEYDAANKLEVFFEAHHGYQITSLTYGEIKESTVTYDLTTEAGLAAAQADPNVELVMEDGVVIDGYVEVPKTRDNYAAVKSAVREYKLTYIYYWDPDNDGVYEVYVEEGPTRVEYTDDIYDPKGQHDVKSVYLPGSTEDQAGALYTLSEWYRTTTLTVFDNPIDITKAKMPASDLTLHAFWEKAPNVVIDDIAVEKKVTGSYTEDQTFTFQAKMGQTNVGQIEIKILANSADPVNKTIPITLTDAQHTMLVKGTGVISIQEVETENNIWNYDSAVYRLSWSNGDFVLTKFGSATPESGLVASFTNTLIAAPDLTVEKTVTSAEAPVEAGDSITWSITVKNSGALAGTFTLEDILTYEGESTGLQGVKIVPPTGVTVADGAYEIAGGDTLVFTATYTVEGKDAGKSLVNTAVVTPKGEDPIKDPADPVDVAPYTVTYVDGVKEKAFATQNYPKQTYGVTTPAFDGDVNKEGAQPPTSYTDDKGDNYTFVGWEPEVAPTVTGHATYVAQWELDNIVDPDKDPDPSKPGDGIPDKYQAMVTYKVEGGTWDGSNADDKFAVFTLKTKDAITGEWNAVDPAPVLGETIPDVSKAQPDATHKTPAYWSPTPYPNDKAVHGTVYIYTFTTRTTPDLTVTKSVNKTKVEVGDTITYSITVTNIGNVTLTEITVTDDFIEGGDEDRTWTIDTLALGESKTLTFRYKTVNADHNGLKNVAVADSNETDPETTDPVDVEVEREPVTPVGPSKPQLNYEDHYAYIVGYPDGLVHPEKNITRAEVATIFFRMLLDESREYFWAQENDFSDVVATDWFNNAISTLANANLINGYPDGNYKPNANITRAEFATIAIRFFLDEDVEIEENNLSDVKEHWAEANINLAYALGLVEGYPDDTFRPDQLITRAEAMTIVNRVLKRAPHEDHLLEDMIEWPDNMDEDMWYYADVQEATNSHEFHMDEKDEYEIWTELLPVRDWVALEREWSEANSSKNPGEVVDININTPEASNEDGILTSN